MKYVIGLSFAALALWFLQATGVFMAIVIFLILGVIPGTSITVPPTYMITILSLLGIIITYLTFRPRSIHTQELFEQVELAEEHANDTLDLASQTSKSISRHALYRLQHQLAATMQHAIKYITRLASVANGTSSAKAHAVVKRILPYIKHAMSWLWVQIRYSLKGTMLSAHRWSSLSKKAWFSLAVWLKRCNSALKRGKSLLIRAAR